VVGVVDADKSQDGLLFADAIPNPQSAMLMDQVLAQLLTGLAYASTLFLVSAGLTLVFGVTRVVNFAHGSLYMLGAYLAVTITGVLPAMPAAFFFGLLLAAAGVAAVGALIEVIVLRRIYAAPEIFQLLATFGVVLIVQDLILAIWGPEEIFGPRAPGLKGSVELAGARVPQYTLFLLVAGPLVFAALWWLVRRTRWGLDVRAATQDGEMAAALGVNRAWLFTSVFALGAFLAALGGALQTPRESVHLQMDLAIIVEAFVVVVVGGLGSIGGAAIASMLIGLLHAFGIWLLPQSSLVLAFVAMALVLIVRPYGLLGRAEIASHGRAPSHAAFVPADARLRVVAVVAVLIAASAPLWSRALADGDFLLVILTDIAILALFAASLHLFMGLGGITSFGHAAFFGLGAYGAALLAKFAGTGLGAALIAGPLLAGGVALAAGLFVLRAQGVYAAMLSLALAQILWSAATQWIALTGGDNGVLGLWPPQLLSGKAAYALFTLALVLASLALLRHIAVAPFGFALRAVRDARARAEASGIDALRTQLAAFAAGGLFAGLAGVLNTYHKGSVFPNVLAIPQSLDALLMLLLGGLNTLSGPIVGAAAYHLLSVELTRATEHWRLVLGVAIVVLVIAAPQGLVGFLRARFERRPA
jgi:branched-chain amino acid transport system permease protein